MGLCTKGEGGRDLPVSVPIIDRHAVYSIGLVHPYENLLLLCSSLRVRKKLWLQWGKGHWIGSTIKGVFN